MSPFHLPLVENDRRKDQVEKDLLGKLCSNMKAFGEQKAQEHATGHSDGALGHVAH